MSPQFFDTKVSKAAKGLGIYFPNGFSEQSGLKHLTALKLFTISPGMVLLVDSNAINLEKATNDFILNHVMEEIKKQKETLKGDTVVNSE